MKITVTFWILGLIFCSACSHLNNELNAITQSKEFSVVEKNQLYKNIETELRAANATHLKECNCMKAFYRSLFDIPDNTSRYVFDSKVGDHAIKRSGGKDTISILAIGSGTLLNELTALSNILARGKNLRIYLTDYSYVFYGDGNFKEKALGFGNNPKTLPPGWKDFYFWAWAKNKEEPFIPFFEKHHQAIDEFKSVIHRLDKIYNTRSTIEVIKPAADHAINLPPLDMIISIDAFIDIPNLIWNLFYVIKLNHSPIRFLALNKAKPLGGFWDSPDLTLRESNSMNAVSIDIYDISSKDGSGSYELVEREIFEPNSEQMKKAPKFVTDPKRDSSQSPLDTTISPKKNKIK